MAQPYDLPLDQLKTYKPELTKQPDFDAFWDRTIARLGEVPAQAELTPFRYPSLRVNVARMQFLGFNHAPIEGWYAVPHSDAPLPGLAVFHGYNSAFDGNIHDIVNLAQHGYAVLSMCVRGQQGNSSDNVVASHGNVSGWITKGIMKPEEYYFRAVYMDAVRAVEVLAARPEVDPARIGVTGASQGGSITLAAAAFSPIPIVACADYPGFANFDRIIDATPHGPLHELNDYFRRYSDPEIERRARITLSYHDIMNIATRVRCHTWMSVGLVDTVVPPSSTFAAYNHLNCSKEMSVYRYFGHEFIPGAQTRKLETLLERLQR